MKLNINQVINIHDSILCNLVHALQNRKFNISTGTNGEHCSKRNATAQHHNKCFYSKYHWLIMPDIHLLSMTLSIFHHLSCLFYWCDSFETFHVYENETKFIWSLWYCLIIDSKSRQLSSLINFCLYYPVLGSLGRGRARYNELLMVHKQINGW